MKKTYRYVLVLFLLIFISPQGIFAEEVIEKEEGATIQQNLTGLALKQPVSVYESTERESTILRNYPYGHLLKFKTYSDEWYEATVFINGERQTGYIHHSDVGEQSAARQVQGIATKKTTVVYNDTSREAKVLRSYGQGRVLKYRAYDKGWFIATVIINGKAETGYIHSNDVETLVDSPETLQGVAIQNQTRVYTQATSSSNTLRTYKYGHILKFKTFTTNWYEATVMVKGKYETGYIHKNDVRSMDTVLTGHAQKSPTTVYSGMTRDSNDLKSYKLGAGLKYRPHDKNWHIATVIIDGKAVQGYLHVDDVGANKPILTGYGVKSSTRVYADTFRSSKIIREYQKGSLLKYKPYNNSWYEATVIIGGKRQTGFIHKNDISSTKPKLSKVDKLKTVGKNDQLILVTSKGSKTSRVKIETYDRDSTGNWQQKLSTTGHIGKNGFAENKKEGDGKSPVGKYTIGTAFGQKGNPGTKLSFRAITNDDVWVDDPKSALYNTWQSRSKTRNQWMSAENMNHRLYTYGFVINYNTKRTPYKGSAIFFHVANSYTVGCTGTSQSNVISILKWLNPKENPVIIQTPEQDITKY